MTAIMGRIIAFTFEVLNMPLSWDGIPWSLWEVILFRVKLFVAFIFIWRVLMFYARKYTT